MMSKEKKEERVTQEEAPAEDTKPSLTLEQLAEEVHKIGRTVEVLNKENLYEEQASIRLYDMSKMYKAGQTVLFTRGNLCGVFACLKNMEKQENGLAIAVKSDGLDGGMVDWKLIPSLKQAGDISEGGYWLWLNLVNNVSGKPQPQ